MIQLPPPPSEYLLPVRTELDTAEDLEFFRVVFRHYQTLNGYHVAETLACLEHLSRHPQISAINASVELKTQSKPLWTKGIGWQCKECNGRAGSIVEGNLVVHCASCGRPVKWYQQKPPRRLTRQSGMR